MANIHPVFHVSQLTICVRVPEKECVPEEEIDLQTDLRHQEVRVKILDSVTKRTRNSKVRICRVQWSRHIVEDEIHFKWGRFVTPAFLSYLNCITNHSLKNLLNLFGRSSSRSPPPDFPPSRHRAVSSSFSVEPPVPFPLPPAPPSRRITIVSWSAACACLAAIVGAARASPVFFSHILFKSILFLSSNSPACLFKLLSNAIIFFV
jgi:hypothetical protein